MNPNLPGFVEKNSRVLRKRQTVMRHRFDTMELFGVVESAIAVKLETNF